MVQRHLTGGLGLYLLIQILRHWNVSRYALAMSQYAIVIGIPARVRVLVLIGLRDELLCRTGTSVQPNLTMHRAQTDRITTHARHGTWIHREECR
jgi:hypothetical protein